MKKIPTIFERDWAGDKSRVLDQPTAAHALICEPDAVATEKIDGTAAMVRDGVLYKRYELRRGKIAPVGFEPCDEPDPKTGKQPGWVPVGDGPEDKWFREPPKPTRDGTYELVGPKVQGNPYDMDTHRYYPHGQAFFVNELPTDFGGLREFLKTHLREGIVWWLNGKPVGKIKRRDFGLPWPIQEGTDG